MADKRTTPEAPGGRRKRAVPTIDLKATEVRSGADASEPAAGAPQPKAEAKPESPAESSASSRSAQTRREEESTAPSQSSPTPRDKEVPSGSARSQSEKKESPMPPPPPGRAGFGGAIAGGIIGAVIVAALMGGLWYGGVLPLQMAEDGTAELRTQIAALQRQVQDLQNRPAPAAPDTAALERRIDTMEKTIANLPAGDASIADRVAAADNAVKSLGIAVTALSRRSDDIAARAAQAEEQAATAEKAVNALRASVQGTGQAAAGGAAPDQLDGLRQRIAALEQSVKSVRAELGETTKALQERIARSSAADRAARLALSASALQTAVVSGAPYAAELAQAKSLGADAQALTPLDPFASSGMPDASALSGQLLAIIPAMREIASPDETGGGFLDRLQANAGRLVRIRPVESPAGDSPADLLARIEAEAAREDIAGALAGLARLPPSVRAPAHDWIVRARARQDALAAAQRFAVESARALGNG
jgi:hypothetical protein